MSNLRPRRAPALLAAGLFAATLVGAPVQIYRAAALDFASASRDLLSALFAAGLVAAFVGALRHSRRQRREEPWRDQNADLRARIGLWVIGLAFVALLIVFVGYILFGYVLRPLMW